MLIRSALSVLRFVFFLCSGVEAFWGFRAKVRSQTWGVSVVAVLSIRQINRRGSKELAIEISVSSEERRGFSWTFPDRMMHKSRVNVVAVLFDLGLYGGGPIRNPVELLDLRHFNCAMVIQI